MNPMSCPRRFFPHTSLLPKPTSLGYLRFWCEHQRMAETEPAVAYFRRNGLVRPQGQESALSLPLFNHTQGEAWRIGRDELTHERSVDGQWEQQGNNLHRFSSARAARRSARPANHV